MDRRAVAGLVFLVLLAAGCGGAGEPRFEHAAGWNVLAEPGQTESAANVSFAAGDRSQSLPSRTIASLPRFGIVIWVEWTRRGRSARVDRTYPRRSLPLRVEDAAYTGAPEGSSCPRTAQRCFIRHLKVSESRLDADVWIFFGAGRPLPEDIAAADDELARLSFPHTAKPSALSEPADCPHPTGTSAFDSSVRPASGPPGSTVVVSGRLPVDSESGRDVGQSSTEVTAYWNLDPLDWPSIASASPVAAVAGSPVRFVGLQNVAGRCSYHVPVTVPSASPGRYPIDVLYGDRQGSASFRPAIFRVTPR